MQDLAHLQRRLTADVEQLARLTAELTTLHTTAMVAGTPTATDGQPHGDADDHVADRAAAGP
jgi:isochorismate synthase EntC